MNKGLTFRTLGIEALRWLTERGANQMHVKDKSKRTLRNRPVLRHPNNKVVTEGEAEDLGFKSEY